MKKLVLIFFTIISTIIVANAQAANAKTSPIDGLVLTPLRSEFEMSPGSQRSLKLRATNATSQPIDVDFHAEAFHVTNEQYDIEFDKEAKIAEWVIFATPSVHLEPGQGKTVEVVIRVPQDAEPGSRYISFFATNSIESAAGGVNSEQRVASLLYLTVKGNVTRKGELKSLNSPIFFDGQGSWQMAVGNSGTAHFVSKYTVSFKNIFTNVTEVTQVDESLILPNSIRSLTTELPTPSHLGIYKVDYLIGLGDTPAVNKSTYVIYIPQAAYISLGIVIILSAVGINHLVHLARQRKMKKQK